MATFTTNQLSQFLHLHHNDQTVYTHQSTITSQFTTVHMFTSANYQCSETVVPPGFCNKGEVRYGSIGGLEYEVPQSRLYCLCINMVLCSTALQCICRVIRRSSMTMKAHTYYIIFGRPPTGGKLPLLAAPLFRNVPVASE